MLSNENPLVGLPGGDLTLSRRLQMCAPGGEAVWFGLAAMAEIHRDGGGCHYTAMVWRVDNLFACFDDAQPVQDYTCESDEEVTGAWRLAFYVRELFM
jgi:hypothetical protein